MASIESLLEGAQTVLLPGKENDKASNQTSSPLMNDFPRYNPDRDSDDEAEEPQELTWRLDPRESLSDFMIEVVIRGKSHGEIYHVHKSVLAIGPKRSTYFARAFFSPPPPPPTQQQQQRPTENERNEWLSCGGIEELMKDHVDTQSSLVRLQLHQLAAEVFPILLDFMYSMQGQVTITTANAVPLYSLAALLEIKTLRKKVRDFWTRDLNMENLCTYYQHARIFKEKRLIAHAEEYCASHIFEVHESVVVDILATVDPFFFLRVVTMPTIGAGDTTSLRLSLLIAVYCNIHKAELDPSMFWGLTDASHLPKLEIKAARTFLELEDKICGVECRHQTSPLKTRCIAVLAENWDVACFKKPETDSERDATKSVSLPRLYGEPLELFASKAFLNAKKRLDWTERERKSLQKKNALLEKKLEATRRQLKDAMLQLGHADPNVSIADSKSDLDSDSCREALDFPDEKEIVGPIGSTVRSTEKVGYVSPSTKEKEETATVQPIFDDYCSPHLTHLNRSRKEEEPRTMTRRAITTATSEANSHQAPLDIRIVKESSPRPIATTVSSIIDDDDSSSYITDHGTR